MTVNVITVSNIGVNGLGVANNTYEMIDQWRRENAAPSLLAVVQLTSSVLFFGNAVYNFRSASVIVEETQTQVLQDYQDSLRSNRHRYVKVKCRIFLPL